MIISGKHWLGLTLNGERGIFHKPLRKDDMVMIWAKGLPKGFVIFHKGTADLDALRKLPVVVDEKDQPIDPMLYLKREWKNSNGK